MNPGMFIVFSSPAGSTRHIAAVIEKELKRLHADVKSLDLKNQKELSTFQNLITSAEKNACLFIGSPVYRGLAVPPIMSFIKTLGQNHHHYAVPFATWGGASSGIALWQMGKALKDKGFELAGAAKAIGFHSMMYDEADPLGQGRPNSQDDDIVEQMMATIYEGLSNNRLSPLALEVLDYQTEAIALKNKGAMTQPWKVTPKIVHETKCTQCEVCKAECPVNAIALKPYPQFGSSCIDCLNCVRLCPEKAVVLTEVLTVRIEQIKLRAKTRDEKPHTQAFV
ncbi:EFR1 family ferrodoxin [Thermodesulfobacteriota bacterium]